jgi:hypothetical protein
METFDKKHIVPLILGCIAFMFTLLFFTTYSKAQTAFQRGKAEQYAEISEKITEAKAILDGITVPEKSDMFYPDQKNSKGETLSRLRYGRGLAQFVFNNCSPEVADVWQDVAAYAQSKGIRPEIVFAIAWADTACGNAMTTPNNYGNVANNDRGNRAGFFTPLDGFKAITDTLNNQYMRGIEKAGHLSQGGRDVIGAQHDCNDAPAPFKCYASSPENFAANMLRALKVIFDTEDIDLNFSFRT